MITDEQRFFMRSVFHDFEFDATRERAALDRLRAIRANDRVVTDPEVIGMEVLTNSHLWETVHAITHRVDGTYWVRTFNHTYRSIPTWELREVSGSQPEAQEG